MRAEPYVAAIVLTWNGCEYTVACLRSLAQMTVVPACTILVDNGSTDNTVVAVQQQFPHVIVLQNRENLGYARGNNRGIQFALARGAGYLFLLNNDIVVDPECLAALLSVAEADPQIGAVGPKVYYRERPEHLQSAGGLITWQAPPTRLIGEDERDHGQYDRLCDVDFLTGCALLVKHAVVERVGLLDPDFFAYYEDADWSIRIRCAGFRLVYVPQARVWHVARGAPGNQAAFRAYYNHRNALLFTHKHAPCRIRWLAYLRSLQIAGKQCLRALTPSRRAEALAGLRGIRDFYLHRLERGTYRLPHPQQGGELG